MNVRSTFLIITWGCLSAASGCRRETRAEAGEVQPATSEIRVTQKQIEEAGITTDVVEVRPMGTTLAVTGRVTFSDARVAHVFSPVTGRVTQLLVGLGQTVEQGTPLAVVQSPDVGSAVADVRKADADLAAAERDYQRQKELYEAHAAAQRDYEAAESVYLKARAERERAAEKSALLVSSTSGGGGAQQYILRSPIGGEVAARNVSPGMEIQGQYSGGSAPELFTIANLDRVWVLADVFEPDIPRLQVGSPVIITAVSYPDRQFSGRLDWISGSLDPSMRTARVRCTIDNSQHLLRPEMFATVSITTDTHKKLAVPRAAVVRLGNDMIAFVDKGPLTGGERFERRRVAVDESDAGDFIPVISGLSAGEKVVTSGSVILSGSSNG